MGGEIYSTGHHGRPVAGGEFHGVLKSVTLTVERISIVITEPEKRIQGFYQRTSNEQLEFTYELNEFAGQEKNLPYGRHAIIVRDGSGDRRIVFYPPRESSAVADE